METQQVVIAHFTTVDDARAAMNTIRELDAQGFVTIGEAALITRDADGTMHATPADGGAQRGAALGGVVGVLIGGLIGLPIVGLLAGAGTGTVSGTDSDFLDGLINDVATKMENGGSAIAVTVESISDPATVNERFERHRASLLFSTVPPGVRAALDDLQS